jgi:hypothetical protein
VNNMTNTNNAHSMPVCKTGMRVPVSGWWEDQHGERSYHEAHRTFPPCIGRKGECAHRRLVKLA